MHTDIHGLRHALQELELHTKATPDSALEGQLVQLKDAALRMVTALGAIYLADDPRLSTLAELAIRREGFSPAVAALTVMLSALPLQTPAAH